MVMQSPHPKLPNLKNKKQKLLYRASYRGTAEMDFLIGGFAKARLAELDEKLLADFECLLKMPDPELEGLVWGRVPLEESSGLTEILGLVQVFHGIDTAGV